MRLSWEKLLSTKRVSEYETCSMKPKKSDYLDPRSAFEKDFDQIIYSSQFRRLQDKTQVIPFPKYDFVHTRLTHSLEVASIGRSLGKMSFENISKDWESIPFSSQDIGALVAAACLAHDIGNPPFGHSGEDSISHFFRHKSDIGSSFDWESKLGFQIYFLFDEFGIIKLSKDQLGSEIVSGHDIIEFQKKASDLTNFEGNANGFQILTQNCDKGINPTSALLGTFSKYPRESYLINNPISKNKSASIKKYGFFNKSREFFGLLVNELGLIRHGEIHDNDMAFHRHPLTFLMEAADDIAYRMIDFEDGLRLKLIDFTKTYTIENKKKEKIQISPFEILLNLSSVDTNFEKEQVESIAKDNDKIAYLRSCVINVLTHEVFKVFDKEYENIMTCKFDISLLDCVSSTVINENLFYMRELIKLYVYNYEPVLENEAAGFEVLGNLIESFALTTNICLSCNESPNAQQKKILSLLPEEFRPNQESIPQTISFDEIYKRYLKILEYVTGMTDNYAINKYRKIKGIEISE